MKKEARQFDHIIGKHRPQDYDQTWETIEKFRLNDDVVLTTDEGHEIITSREQAHRLGKKR